MTKSIFASKTFWVNIIALLIMLVQTQTGFVIDGEAQAAILVVINLILRFVTKSPVTWTTGKGKNDTIAYLLVWLWIPAFAGMMMMTGCAAMREGAISLSKEDRKNVTAMRAVAKNLLKTWPMTSGIIKGTLGNRMMEMPVDAVNAIVELDALAAQEKWTDEELGKSLGIRVRMLSTIVKETLKMFAPDVLDLIPIL